MPVTLSFLPEGVPGGIRTVTDPSRVGTETSADCPICEDDKLRIVYATEAGKSVDEMFGCSGSLMPSGTLIAARVEEIYEADDGEVLVGGRQES